MLYTEVHTETLGHFIAICDLVLYLVHPVLYKADLLVVLVHTVCFCLLDSFGKGLHACLKTFLLPTLLILHHLMLNVDLSRFFKLLIHLKLEYITILSQYGLRLLELFQFLMRLLYVLTQVVHQQLAIVQLLGSHFFDLALNSHKPALPTFQLSLVLGEGSCDIVRQLVIQLPNLPVVISRLLLQLCLEFVEAVIELISLINDFLEPLYNILHLVETTHVFASHCTVFVNEFLLQSHLFHWFLDQLEDQFFDSSLETDKVDLIHALCDLLDKLAGNDF